MRRLVPLLVLVGFGAVASAARASDDLKDEFEAWIQRFGVSIHEPEYTKRMEIFEMNSKKIRSHNQNSNATFTLRHNAFSHLHWDEFRSMHLGFLPQEEGQGQGAGAGDGKGGPPPPPPPPHRRVRAPAAAVDWEAKGATTPVKDQGQCGSCWAFSATEAIESALYLTHGGDPTALSVQEVVDCTWLSLGCNGGQMDSAFRFAGRAGGLCKEEDYSYHAKSGSCKRKSCTPVDGSKVVSWVDVERGDEAALRAALTLQPVSVAIEADQEAFQFYGGGVLTGACGHRLDHGVLAVGYGEDAPTGLPFWKVRNSWGADWGEGGYVRLARGEGGRDGQCGILDSASYPVLAKKAAAGVGARPPAPAAAAAAAVASAAAVGEARRAEVAEEGAAPAVVPPPPQRGDVYFVRKGGGSGAATARDCGGAAITFDEFSLPDDVKKGEKLKIVAYGTVNPDVGVISGGDVDIRVQLDGDSVYSAGAGLCGDQSIALPLHLGTLDVRGLACPAHGKVAFQVDFKLPIIAPGGTYTVLAKGSEDAGGDVCVQIDLSL